LQYLGQNYSKINRFIKLQYIRLNFKSTPAACVWQPVEPAAETGIHAVKRSLRLPAGSVDLSKLRLQTVWQQLYGRHGHLSQTAGHAAAGPSKHPARRPAGPKRSPARNWRRPLCTVRVTLSHLQPPTQDASPSKRFRRVSTSADARSTVQTSWL